MFENRWRENKWKCKILVNVSRFFGLGARWPALNSTVRCAGLVFVYQGLVVKKNSICDVHCQYKIMKIAL